MNAKKCDRCKKFYERNTVKYKGQFIDGICLTNRRQSVSFSHKDLCDACLESLDEWLMDGESEATQTP